MTLGQRLAFHRKQKALTQQQLGEQLNVSAQAISKWENDQAEPDVATVLKLAQIYHISLDLLLTGKEAVTENAAPEQAPVPQVPEAVKPTEANQAPVTKLAAKAPANTKKPRKRKILLPMILVTVLALFITAGVIFLNTVVLIPCSKYNVERLSLGMKPADVKKILGDPHSEKQYLVDKADGSIYEDDAGILGGLMSGFYGDESYDAFNVWYYYSGPLSEIEKLNEKINGATTWEELEEISNEIEKLEKKASEKPYRQLMIAFNENGVVKEIYLNTQMTVGSTDYSQAKKVKSTSAPSVKKTTDRTGVLQSNCVEIFFTDGSYYKTIFSESTEISLLYDETSPTIFYDSEDMNSVLIKRETPFGIIEFELSLVK